MWLFEPKVLLVWAYVTNLVGKTFYLYTCMCMSVEDNDQVTKH